MWALAASATTMASGPVRAAGLGNELDMCDVGAPCHVASAAQLDALRGGFYLKIDSGPLRVGIGITRTVSINGRVVAVSQITIPDLGAAATARGHHHAGPDLNALQNGGVLIVQNGPGNIAPSLASFGSAIPTIVQNTIDNQKLSTFTIVNAWVNSLSVMQTLRTSEMLQRATAASGR
ncbi:MAG TPA: hypothetical protein VFM23_07400 [Gemmatimonadales bacterium]|nr:hypothetical protein [Gemmatimonadales bacterium]